MSTANLPPERRSEIARNAGKANKSKGRGIKPCRNAPDGPHLVPAEGCKRCRLRESEKRSRARKNGEVTEAQLESAYRPERANALMLLAKLTRLVEDHDALTRWHRVWGDIGDLERVVSSLQTAVDVLEG